MAGWLEYLVDARFAIVWSALPPTGMGVWAFWKYQLDRRDKRAEASDTRESTREERRSRELDKQQESFSAEQQRWVADLRQENKDLRTELNETRRDRDRGWTVARWWYGAAHELLRLFRNLRHNALNMMQLIQSAMKQYPALGISSTYIDPIPDRPDLPLGLDDIPDK